jgi:hypothetical protein
MEETTEDWKGLWELCWALRSDLSMSGSDAELGEIMSPILLGLLSRNLIKVSRRQWAKSEFKPAPVDEVATIFADKTNWSASPDKEHYSIWCAATEEGYRVFKRSLQSKKH